MGEEIMRKLLGQVFKPENLNASLIISGKYGGKDKYGYSKKTVSIRRKKINNFINKIKSDFEVFLDCTEHVKETEEKEEEM